MSREPELLAKIAEAWGWRGLEPSAVVGENEFGNLLVKDSAGKYWRICPEDVYCKVIALDDHAFHKLVDDVDFQQDWEMAPLAEAARSKFGTLGPGRRYCFAIPGILGGAYSAENIRHAPLLEIIGMAGDIGQQLKDLSDGSQIQLKVVP
jgi:hypothetical protein